MQRLLVCLLFALAALAPALLSGCSRHSSYKGVSPSTPEEEKICAYIVRGCDSYTATTGEADVPTFLAWGPHSYNPEKGTWSIRVQWKEKNDNGNGQEVTKDYTFLLHRLATEPNVMVPTGW